jgi:hypothetical protein
MQIKTTPRFHLTAVRIAIITNTIINRCWKGCGEKGTLTHGWWECKLVQPLWKTIWRLLKNLKIDLPYDPAIPLLGIYPKGCDTGNSRGTCTLMFIAALFTIAKLWKQPRCLILTSGLRKCGVYTQWNFTQPWRRMKSYHSQVNGWNMRTSFWGGLARLRRPKVICSPSYADFRSRTNTVMLLDFGHTWWGQHIQEEWG